MVRRDDEFSDVHRYILQLLAQELALVGRQHLELSPVCIARNIGYKDSDYVGRSCRELESYGLLRRADSGPYYSITETGKRYIAGKISFTEIEY